MCDRTSRAAAPAPRRSRIAYAARTCVVGGEADATRHNALQPVGYKIYKHMTETPHTAIRDATPTGTDRRSGANRTTLYSITDATERAARRPIRVP